MLLTLSEPRLPAIFLLGGFFSGVFFLHPEKSEQDQSLFSSYEFCVDEQPFLTKGGEWVSGNKTEEVGDRPIRIRLFIPANRLPQEPVVTGDCLSGTATPFPSLLRTGFFLPDHPSFRVAPSDVLTFLPGSSPINQLMRIAYETKQNLGQEILHIFPRDTAGLLSSLILSDTRYLPQESQDNFRKAGVSHLLSVSGEHMTLLAIFLAGAFLLLLRIMPLRFLRLINVRIPLSRIVIALTVPLLALYTLMIGLPPAAVRAFLAFALFSTLKLFFVDLEFAEILGLSTFIMLLVLPELIHSLSFLLSLLALWGLVIVQRLPKRLQPSRTLPSTIYQSFRAGIVITLFTAPLLALQFKTANPAGIIANPFLVPMAGDLLLPLGFSDLLFLLLTSHIPSIFRIATNTLSHGVLGLADGFARLPGSEVVIPRIQPVLVLVFYGAILFLLIEHSFKIRRVLLLLTLLMFLSMAVPSPSNLEHFKRALVYLDPGQLSYEPTIERSNLVRLIR